MNNKKYSKVGKAIAIIVALLLIASLAIPAFANGHSKNNNLNVISMTEPTEIKFEAEVFEDAVASDLTWYFGDKEIKDWKKWSMETGDFTAGQYITFTEEPVVSKGTVKATIKFDRLFDTTDLSQRGPFNIRLLYPEFIGSYDIKAVDKNNKEAKMKVELVPYESYMSYNQMKDAIESIKANAKSDRYVTIESVGTSVQGKTMDLGIIAKDKKSIDDYLNITTPMMLENPEQMISDIKNKKAKYKSVIFMNNIHPDEQPGVDAIVKLFNTYATEDSVSFETTDDKEKNKKEKLKISKLLDDYILVFSFTQNPDGRLANTRENANNIDLNRDNGYQTQPETKAVTAQISKYNPLIFLDYHGFVSEFLIEPCTPPHDPNYETDLLYDSMLDLANVMGKAGIANSKYESYIIPSVDWGTGWDDATSAYTATYAMHHGALGHTIEVPEMNEESYKAAVHTGYAAAQYAIDNKDMLMLNKLEYYKRGIEKIDSPKADKALVDSNGAIKGRPRGDNENFFPDYYVIPMGIDSQKNTVAAFDMIEYFNRNGVIVNQLKADKNTFKQGDLVVDMAQAKRGYANHILYSGVDESEWEEMYAEIVANFPAQRGFDVVQVREADLFNDMLEEVKHTKPTSSKLIESDFYLIHNNSNESVKAINYAISNGHKVVKADLGQGKAGFAVDKSAMIDLSSKYSLKFDEIESMPSGKEIKTTTIYAPSDSTLYHALKELGFNVVVEESAAQIIVTDSGEIDPETIGTKKMIAVGGYAMLAIAESNKIAGLEVDATDSYHEGLLKSTNNIASPYTMGYPEKDTMYSSTGTWMTKLPQEFTALTTVDSTEDYFIAGWWPEHDKVKGQIMSAVGTVNNYETVLYAGNLSNRLHTQYLYRWLSNAVYEIQ